VNDQELHPSPGEAVAMSDDVLWRHLKTVPAFRALLRSVESRFYQHIVLPEPTLDLGCGDGHFAQMTFDHALAAGVDPWWGPLIKATASGAYRLPVQALGGSLPFADNAFGSVLSNSVLEHIDDVQPVLTEVARVLEPGGIFVMTTPNHHFTKLLGGALILERLGLKGWARRYRAFFNAISRHAHTDPPEQWAARLAEAGLRVDRWQYYFSRKALHALELGHIQGLPSAVLHFLTGHWILAPWKSNLRLTERWVRPHFQEEAPIVGTMTLMIASKTGSASMEAILPPPRVISTV
jgi:SAM-dependent methyltransferase